MLGKGGVGKTVTAKFFGRNFKNIALENDLEVFLEYYNCAYFQTRNKILSDAVEKYSHESERGLSDVEALKLILTKLINTNGYMLLIIDEVQLLKFEDIFAFLNIAETYGNQNTRLSILLIARTENWIQIKTERIVSKLNDIIILKPYTYEESKEILQYRCDLAFKKDVLTPNLIDKIAKIVIDKKSMNYGIQILRKAGIYADEQGIDTINVEVIDKVMNSEIFRDQKVKGSVTYNPIDL
jgi:Cdc6-like AAA superfamily ATPase